MFNKCRLKLLQDANVTKGRRKRYNQRLVQGVLYLTEGIASTPSITSCGRLPFPVHCIYCFPPPLKKYCNSFFKISSTVCMILSFAPKDQQVIAFVRLHMWIKQCKTVNKITFLLYVIRFTPNALTQTSETKTHNVHIGVQCLWELLTAAYIRDN